jgi:uncharacterized phage protein (TIGR01671 family)
MREIKFRAWDGRGLDMVYHVGVGSKGEAPIWDEHNGPLDGMHEYPQYESWGLGDLILMQFTGLKDKNGKEIYEGDIVHISHMLPYTCEVKWIRGGWSMDDPWDDREIPLQHVTEVVGNIYENGDLLKGKE